MDNRSRMIGRKIREIRKKKGITQDELGTAIGVTRQQMGRLETGSRTLKPDTLDLIARALVVPRSALEELENRADLVAELFGQVGYDVTRDQVVCDVDGHPCHVNVIASSGAGVMGVRVLVLLRPVLGLEDVVQVVRLLASTAYHKAVFVVDTQWSPEVEAFARSNGVDLALHDEFLSRFIDFGPYARALVEAFEEEARLFVQPMGRQVGQPDWLDLTDHLWEHWLQGDSPRHVMLLGEAGAGKSTVSRYLAYRLAQAYLHDPVGNPLVPIVVPLWEFPHVDDLEQLVFKEILFRHRTLVRNQAVLHRMLLDDRFVIFLDGFDEMVSRGRHGVVYRVKRAIAQFMERGSRVMVTSRPQSLPATQAWVLSTATPLLAPLMHQRDDSLIQVCELLRFDDARKLQFLTRHFPRRAEEELAWIKDSMLDEMAGVPLYLRMLVFLRREQPSRIRRGMSSVELLDLAYESWVDVEAERKGYDSRRLRRFVERLAFHLYREGESQVSYANIPPEAWQALGRQPVAGNAVADDDPGRDDIPPMEDRGLFDNLFLSIDEPGNVRLTQQIYAMFLTAAHARHEISLNRNEVLRGIWFDRVVADMLSEMIAWEPHGQNLRRWLLGNTDASVREFSAFILGRAQFAAAAEALDAVFSRADLLAVRASCAYALAWMGQVDVLPRLGAMARARGEPLCGTMAQALLVLLQNELPRPLEPAFEEALARAGDGWLMDDALFSFRQALVDPDEDESVRCTVARALGHAGVLTDLHLLQQHQRSSGKRLRLAAREAASLLEPHAEG